MHSIQNRKLRKTLTREPGLDLRVNFMLLPCVILGSILGIWLVRRISGPLFEKIMRFMVLAGGIKLFF